MPKTSLRANYRRSMQKTAPKNTKYAKNETILKMKKWPLRKDYSLCKMVSLGQKIKLPKTCQKRLYERIRGVLCKKRLQKTLNMREMRQF